MKKYLKRLLSVALALVLTMSLVLPVAAEEDTTGTIRSVGSYDALIAALNAAQGGDTIVLTDNITVTSKLEVKANLLVTSAEGGIKTLTFDGIHTGFEVLAGVSAFELRNVSLVNNAMPHDGATHPQLVDVKASNATVTLDGVTTSAGTHYAVNLRGASTGTDVTVKDSTLSGANVFNVWSTDHTITVINSDLTAISPNEYTFAVFAFNSNSSYINQNNAVIVDADSSLTAKISESYPDTHGYIVQVHSEAVEGGRNAGLTVKIADGATLNKLYSDDPVMKHGVARIGDVYYTSLSAAIAAANDNDTITLLEDVNTDQRFVLEKPLIIDGNGHTVTSSEKKTFEVFANATFKNISVLNTYQTTDSDDTTGRCINTRVGNITLNLENVELESTGTSNTQTFLIGGTGEKVTVNIKDSTVRATDSGYAFITFLPVDLTVDNSELSGYSALYFKEGSAGSSVTVKNSSKILSRNVHATGTNDFGTIVFEDGNIAVSAQGSTLGVTGKKDTADKDYAVNYLIMNKGNTGISVSAAADCTVDVTEACLVYGFPVNTQQMTVKLPESTKDQLTAEGYYYTVSNGVAQITCAEEHDHILEQVVIAPSCFKDGEIAHYECTLCGKDFEDKDGTKELTSVVDPATGNHNWSTDFQPGEDTHWNYCKNEGCTAKKNEAAHTWGKKHMDNAHIVTDANNNACAVAYHISCDVCAKSHATDIFWVKQENPVHAYDNGVVTKEATCTATGIMTYTCQNAGCGHTKTETIAKKAHTEAEIPAKAATCTEPGLTAGKKCSVCGEILAAQIETPATGHDWGYRFGVTPEGNKHWMWCRNFCGADPKEMGDHVYTHSDDLSKYQVMHETECGTIVYRLPECEVCGFDGPVTAAQKKVYKEDGEHVFDEGEVIKKSTCSEAGEIVYTCTVELCGFEKTEKLPLAAHTLKKVEGKAATYSAAGVKEHYICSACDALFADAEGKTAITDVVIPQLIKVEGTTAKVETGAVDSALTEAVEKAEESGAKAEVIIEVEKAVDTEASTDPSAPADTVKPEDVEKVVEVQLPVASIDKVVEAEAELTVVMPNVTVTMDTEALKAVSDQAAGEAVTLVVEEVKTESLTVAQQKTVEKYDVAVTITAELICQTTGEKIWTEKANDAIESGSITVKLPFTPAENTKGSDYAVLFIDDDGSVTEIETEFVDGHLVFALEHFSDYVVVNTAAKAYPDSPATGDTANVALLVALVVVSLAGLVACGVLVKKNRYIPKH